MVSDRGFGSGLRTSGLVSSDTTPAMRRRALPFAIRVRAWVRAAMECRGVGAPGVFSRRPADPPADMQMVSLTLRVMSRPDMTHLPKIYQSLGQE